MSEISIPCDTIARLANVLKYFPESADEWTDSLRLEDNFIMATNRCYMAVERITANIPTPIHIKADPVFIAQCVTESQYSSNVFLVINHALGMVTARTTMGYQFPGNLLLTSQTPNKLDNWKAVIPRDTSKVANGGMMLDMAQFMMLAETAPSKQIVFEQYVDITRPTIVRDLHDPDWFGVFNAKDINNIHDPATLPRWFK